MKFKVINVFPLNDETSEEEFKKLLTEEYIALWSAIPSLLKIEILKPQGISSSFPWKSEKLYAVIETWESKEAYDEDVRRISQDTTYADEVAAGRKVLQKWAECTAPEKPLYLHCAVTHEAE